MSNFSLFLNFSRSKPVRRRWREEVYLTLGYHHSKWLIARIEESGEAFRREFRSQSIH